MTHRSLTPSDIRQLIQQGCSASDWSGIAVHPRTDLLRLQRVRFSGRVTVGATDGEISLDGIPLPCGIYDAAVADCQIGDGVRIAAVGGVVANYRVEAGALIQNVGTLVAEPGAAFGNGVELEVVNEGGGRGTRMLEDLTAQTAYLQAMRRHDKELTRRLHLLVDERVAASRQSGGVVGEGVRLLHCGEIRNVRFGAYANVHGARRLEDGSILSCREHPTEVGDGVDARHFIVAEGARIDSGVVLDKVYVGQAAKLGKQFSAENSLFFANCEGFHGEAVSLFAGPYTVTHHKSTLLIAGIFSFYNAGSGTNQSNHMYKLGPVHQGIFERGCKTGSFSYVLLESHVGAFSVIIGKHFSNLNTPNLPFSYINEEQGVSRLVPAMNLFSVGTIRDGEKWPKRDGRKAPLKRDLIVFDVFSPYTVEKMRRGRDELAQMAASASREKEFVAYGGTQINRLLLRKGSKYYASAVTRYLAGRICARLEEVLRRQRRWREAIAELEPSGTLRQPADWTDLGGLLAARERVSAIEEGVRSGAIGTYDELLRRLAEVQAAYAGDEWEYVVHAAGQEFGLPPQRFTRDKALEVIELWKQTSISTLSSIVEDAKREFGAAARIGFGLDLSETERDADFEAVRGSVETNSVVQKLNKELADVQHRAAELVRLVNDATE